MLDLKTRAIVLRRVNYGEADRIVDLITPTGRHSAIAKGSRREKSKMAGGIELFSLSDVVIRRKKEDGLGILSSVRLVEFFGQSILSDWDRLELAGEIVREVAKRSSGVTGAETSDENAFFTITEQSLRALSDSTHIDLIRAWFRLQLLQAAGDPINLHRDSSGDKLEQDQNYSWDIASSALALDGCGDIGTDQIKIMRLIMTSKLSLVDKIPDAHLIWPIIDRITSI